MKISSTVITGLARAFQRARPVMDDSDPTIPPILLPTLSLRQPLQAFLAVGPSINIAQEASFSFAALQTRVNQGDDTSVLGVLGPGLWEVAFQAHFTSNAAVGGTQARLELVIPDSSTFRMYQMPHQIGTFLLAGEVTFSVARDSTLQLFTPGNGAGQTNEHGITFLASRLN